MQMHRVFTLGMLMALPALAPAQEQHCRYWQARDLPMDLAGIRRVAFEVGRHDLRLTAGPAGEAGFLQGRACASGESRLPELQLAQEKRGDLLTVRLQNPNERGSITPFGDNYAYLQIHGIIPDTIAVALNVGSGDAELVGAASADVVVGSGDANIRNTRGEVRATAGSGDVDIDGASGVDFRAVGSGDAEVKRIRGPVTIGTVGSGDMKMRGVQGNIDIRTVGSGDIEIGNVTGNVSVGAIGSGDLSVSDARGDLRVRSKGSGSIEHQGVSGSVDIPRR
ncbi:MAG: DUF2807 domain-containing protein [Xanthomonadaceae bacterium]|jgi:hypothetical protein|nr:DUF2807 domain-containing protein [Xanthomonadaceae bacterium]